jgi:hypothetical protein
MLALASAHAAASYVTFDVPGATTTYPICMNNNGDVAGIWGNGGSAHGFLRTSDGTITTFDPPHSVDTRVTSINIKATVSGYYQTSDNVIHAFYRTTDGIVNTFDAPGQNASTYLAGINDGGQLTGLYFNSQVANNAYLTVPGGRFFSFAPPNATGTFPASLNNTGEVAGSYTANDGQGYHGFLLANGTVTTFDAPGSVGSSLGTDASSINATGMITGASGIAAPKPFQPSVQGFIRAADGTFTTFHVLNRPTYPQSINSSGQITGNWRDAQAYYHGFFRDTNGRITILNENPNAKATAPVAINDSGVIAGAFMDQNGVDHGFVRLP